MAAPKAKCIQLLGNHDMRRSKRILEKMPELAKEIEEIEKKYYKFKGVKSYGSDRDFVILDGVIYCHGWLTKNNAHKAFFSRGGKRYSVVRCHSHRADIHYDPLSRTDFIPWFEVDAGNCIDYKTAPIQYTASRMTHWQHACAYIEDGKPELIIL